MRGWTALHYASLFAQPVAVKALLKAGAHPSSENTLGALLACFTCLHSPSLALHDPVLCLLVSAATPARQKRKSFLASILPNLC